jgi:hypothetical protein
VKQGDGRKMFWQPGGPEMRYGKSFSDSVFRTRGDGRFFSLSFLPSPPYTNNKASSVIVG